MNEFELIEAILDRLGGRAGVPGVSLASGDDTALFESGDWPLVTVDTMVEGVHWDPSFSAPADVGFKLLASNLSDIAAMGGVPGPMLLALTVRPEARAFDIPELCRGIDEARLAHGLGDSAVVPIGGDLTHTPGPQVFTLVLFGRPGGSGRVLRRNGARSGDGIWVSGPLGSAQAGLDLLRAGQDAGGDFEPLIRRHRRPLARLELGQALVNDPRVHAALDLSDGLAGDLRHILDSSKVGAEVSVGALPCDPLLAEAARRIGKEPIPLMLAGGEDYQLLVTADPSCDPALEALGMTRVGRVVEAQTLTFLDEDGRALPLEISGYRHF